MKVVIVGYENISHMILDGVSNIFLRAYIPAKNKFDYMTIEKLYNLKIRNQKYLVFNLRTPDKDCNDNFIYVGDFLEITYNSYGTKSNGKIIEVFCGGEYYLLCKKIIHVDDARTFIPSIYFGINATKPTVTIIGNSIQHPELLKKVNAVKKRVIKNSKK